MFAMFTPKSPHFFTDNFISMVYNFDFSFAALLKTRNFFPQVVTFIRVTFHEAINRAK